MNKRNYKKPEMNFVALRGENAVADTCWAYANNKKIFYYDYPGPGYLKLNLRKVTNGCDGAKVENVVYYNQNGNEDNANKPADADSIVQAAVDQARGNSAEPFAGFGTDFSDNPNPGWS